MTDSSDSELRSTKFLDDILCQTIQCRTTDAQMSHHFVSRHETINAEFVTPQLVSGRNVFRKSNHDSPVPFTLSQIELAGL